MSILKTQESKTRKHKAFVIHFIQIQSTQTYPDEMISWPHGIRSLNSQFNLEWRQVNWIINKAPMANLDILCSDFWLNMTRWRMLSNKVKQQDGSTCIEISLGMWRPGPFNTYTWINIPINLMSIPPHCTCACLKKQPYVPPPQCSWLPAICMMPMHMLVNIKDHLLQRDWTMCS